MRACLLIAAVLAAFSFASFAAASPSVCDRRDALVAYLGANHGERRVAAGIDGQGLLVEVFVGPEGGWSILLTRPNGTSCMVAAGQGWEFFGIAIGRET